MLVERGLSRKELQKREDAKMQPGYRKKLKTEEEGFTSGRVRPLQSGVAAKKESGVFLDAVREEEGN